MDKYEIEDELKGKSIILLLHLDFVKCLMFIIASI
jgi:hypothetical protein